MSKLIRRIYYLLNRRRLDRELDDEMAAHREMMAEDRKTHFGDLRRLREESAERWGWMWLDDLWRDLAYGAHSLWRSPGFTVTAVLVLALGMGVNLAEVEVFNASLHRLHARDMDTLVRFSRSFGEYAPILFKPEAAAFYREYNSSFSSIFLETPAGNLITMDGDPAPLRASFVSGNYFGTLGILPIYGRMLDEVDAKPGAAPVSVLGYGYWQDKFGSDPAIVGRTIRLNGKPVRVVGVGPDSFSGIAQVRTFVWLPQSLQPYLISVTRARGPGAEDPFGPAMFGRLKPGVTLAAAQSEIQSLAPQLQKQRPGLFQPGERIRVRRIDSLDLNAALIEIGSLWILLVLSVLLVACANLGNMLLARGLARRREMEIRQAIGAGQGRIVRQLMTENLLLASIAAVVALGVGRAAARVLSNVIAQPDLRPVTDWHLLAAAVLLALIAVFAFGLTPAIRTVRGGPRTARAGKSLVSFQVAISCAFLIFASLLTRGMLRNLGDGVAFDYAHMIVVNPALYLDGLNASGARQDLDDRMSRVRRVSAVDGVTRAWGAPFGSGRWIDKPPGSPRSLYLNAVDGSYFDVLRLPLLAGRSFGPAEQDAMVVSQSAARALWPGGQPLGKSIDLQGRSRRVVGVVGDSGVSNVVAPTSVEAYLPMNDESIPLTVLLVHTTGKTTSLLDVVRAAASEGGRAPLVSSLEHDLGEQREGSRRLLLVIGTLGAVATVLAAAGIFGLIAFTVSQRTREIGVRLALGASRSRILATVLGQYLVPVGIGLVAGLTVAAGAAGILRKALSELPAFDLVSYAAALLCFVIIAFGAALLPCRKALKIEPSAVLRCD